MTKLPIRVSLAVALLAAASCKDATAPGSGLFRVDDLKLEVIPDIGPTTNQLVDFPAIPDPTNQYTGKPRAPINLDFEQQINPSLLYFGAEFPRIGVKSGPQRGTFHGSLRSSVGSVPGRKNSV